MENLGHRAGVSGGIDLSARRRWRTLKGATMKDIKTAPEAAKDQKAVWEKPSIEEVSQRVMAQPYIRFT